MGETSEYALTHKHSHNVYGQVLKEVRPDLTHKLEDIILFFLLKIAWKDVDTR